ncbi:DUF4332 domain-containing protein [Marinobacter sp. X15-166B]|uniref:DUF4332 domain-containing protein n=1 Tax=Marinobacter sp. X15-166B TaxID=1897620 RepID=UPI00085C55A5|nr:DUF4332 domain-containing protein [Marinobacter sp. X15-166B]OEY65818.1 ferredoxin [Marinobacter sp. X15-166B]
MTKLADIEGIGAVQAGKLEQAGISSVEQLLAACGHKKGRQQTAEACGISEKLILGWVNRADLARIKGISTQYADLLEHAGVDTVPELAQRNPDNLHTKMAEINESRRLVRQLPGLSQVSDWVTQAKALPRAVTH